MKDEAREPELFPRNTRKSERDPWNFKSSLHSLSLRIITFGILIREISSRYEIMSIDNLMYIYAIATSIETREKTKVDLIVYKLRILYTPL